MESTLLLYLFDLRTVSEDEIAQLKSLLNPEQQHKYDSINKRKKAEFVLSRSLLTFGVRQALENEHAIFGIQEQSQLPPLVTLAKQHNIQFSISHSQHMIGIAIVQGKQAVGFDIQVFKDFSKELNFPKNSIESAQYFCNESQLSILNDYSNDKALFARHYTQLWANKEAYLKSLQLGINHELLKKTGFIKATNPHSHLHASILKNDLQGTFALALYCEKSYKIVSHTLTLKQLKFCIKKPNFQLNWEAFNIKI